MTIFLAIVAFCVIIIVHEMGHFFVAKACGMKVYEFSIGMGPKILKKQGKDTLYSLRLFPIGGSVQLGEDDEEENVDPRAYRNKPVWQRMLVMLAGAFMNIVLGIVICAVAILSSGVVVSNEIGGFTNDNSMSSQSLQIGDKILSINGLPIWSSMDISYALSNTKAFDNMVLDENGKETNVVNFIFTVERNGETLTLENVQFEKQLRKDKQNAINLDFAINAYSLNFGNVVASSFQTAASYGRLVIMSLFDLIGGTYGINELSGPVGVVSAISEIPLVNVQQLLSIIALITINIGIFNLLPIPALDGARFLFLLVETIRRKPIPIKYEGLVHFIGFAALMIFMVIVTFNDIVRLVTGGGAG